MLYSFFFHSHLEECVCNAVLDNVIAIVSAFIQRLTALSELMFLGKRLQTNHIPAHNLQWRALNTHMGLSDMLGLFLADSSFYSYFLKTFQISFQKAKSNLKFSQDVKDFCCLFSSSQIHVLKRRK